MQITPDPNKYNPLSKGSPLSPLQLQAGQTLLSQNGTIPPLLYDNGLIPATALTANISAYEGTALIDPLKRTIDYNEGATILPATTVTELWQLGASDCPALSDAVPATELTEIENIEKVWRDVLVSTWTKAGWTNFLRCTADLYLGKTADVTALRSTVDRTAHDNGKFSETFGVVNSYCSLTNTFVESAHNAANYYLGDTFTDMNNLTAGELTQVNLDTQGFGTDLKNLGNLINLSALDTLGFPLPLIQQVVKQGGIITPLIIALTLAGVNENIVLQLNDPKLVVTDTVQKSMYAAMTLITGDDLTQVLQILGVTRVKITSSVNTSLSEYNIMTMADLLDPVKIFPNSYSTLQCPTCSGPRGIYIPDTTAVNSKLASELPIATVVTYNRLNRIIPSDTALANKALTVSLEQITNVGKMTLPQLADAYLGVETNKGLPEVNALLTPVSSLATEWYKDNLAIGSGQNGTILTTDLIGTAIGNVHGEKLNSSTTLLGSLTGSGYSNLLQIYQDMYDTITGVYSVDNITYWTVVIPSGPAAGTYGDGTTVTEAEAIQAAFDDGLIPAAQTAIATVVSQNSDTCTALNDNFTAMADKIISESSFQQKANQQFADLTAFPKNQSSIYSFIFGLPSAGLETKTGGTAEYLEAIADVNNSNDSIRLGAQALIGCLREGRSSFATGSNGVGTSNQVPADPETPPPEATLSSSTYTKSEALAQIIT